MTEEQLLGLIDHVSDSLMHFGCYPGEHVIFDEDGMEELAVVDVDEYLKILEQQVPSFARFCENYLLNTED